jgi:hypothetical protein
MKLVEVTGISKNKIIGCPQLAKVLHIDDNLSVRKFFYTLTHVKSKRLSSIKIINLLKQNKTNLALKINL